MAHDHDHSSPPQPDHPEPETYHEFLGVALSDLLIEKGIFTKEDERRRIETMESITPAIGASVVARAWSDDDFAERLRSDGNAAVGEMGIVHMGTDLTVLFNTPDVHNVVVCTLCSCYPRALLGIPPDWYKSRSYRARVVREPRAVLSEFGTNLPEDVEVRVHDSTADLRYLVVPARPEGTDDWSAQALESLITRDTMIGVTLPSV